MIENRRTVMKRSLGSALLLLSFALPLLAQRAIIVDAAGGGDFTEIQPAVDAAGPGRLIRVRHGVYREDVIIRKGIRLIGDRWVRGSGECAHIEGSVRVLDLPANQSFVGSDLLLVFTIGDRRTFNFENCQGNIHLTNSAGRLEIRNCNYVTTDLLIGEANNVEPGAIVADSFLGKMCIWLYSSSWLVLCGQGVEVLLDL